MSTHSEEWVFRSPELAVGRASIAPLTQRATYEHAAPFWAAEFPLILRNEFPALQSSWLGSTLPSERRSVFSFWGMSSPLLRALIIALPAGRASIAPLTIEGYLWACRSLLSGEFPSHSEEWVPRSPELMMGLAAPFWAAECLLILRNEFSTLQSSL